MMGNNISDLSQAHVASPRTESEILASGCRTTCGLYVKGLYSGVNVRRLGHQSLIVFLNLILCHKKWVAANIRTIYSFRGQ